MRPGACALVLCSPVDEDLALAQFVLHPELRVVYHDVPTEKRQRLKDDHDPENTIPHKHQISINNRSSSRRARNDPQSAMVRILSDKIATGPPKVSKKIT